MPDTNEAQWRIVWSHADRDHAPEIQIVNSFQYAWGVARALGVDEDPDWRVADYDTVWPDLSRGQNVRVAWSTQAGITVTLHRL